jgi:hypothetical protein
MTTTPYISICLFCFAFLSLWGQQQPPCATTFNDQFDLRERMFDQRRHSEILLASVEHFRSVNQTIYVPIYFHLVGEDDSTGYISLNQLLENLCYTNSLYSNLAADLDEDGQLDSLTVVFYIDGINKINNSLLYQHTDPAVVSYLMSLYKLPAVVNVFIGNTIGSSGQGTTLGYYNSQLDVINCIKSTISGTSATLAHELGHYFTLAHPHFGWDGLEYVSDPTVIATNCAPSTTANGVLCEKVARSGGGENCQLAADGFCDTNPDYNFGIFSFCTNNIPASDPNCIPLGAPNTDNIMSYFNDACTNAFTAEQTRAIYLDLLARGYIFNQPSSNIPITETPVLNHPIGGQKTFYPEAVHLRWTSVIGATSYLLRIREFFVNGTVPGSIVEERIVHSNQAWFSTTANRYFGWTVKPLSQTGLCNNYTSNEEIFETADWILGQNSKENIKFEARIFPNPAKKFFTLQIESSISQNIRLTIYNQIGQKVHSFQDYEVVAGEQFQHFDVSTLAKGSYYLNIITSNKSYSYQFFKR